MSIGRVFTGVFMLIICLAFVGAGIWMQFYQHSGYVKTDAVITEIVSSSSHSAGKRTRNSVPIVRYTVDGNTYEGPSNVWESGMRAGQTITVYYNPENPAQISGDPGWLGWFFIGIGGFSAICSLAVMFSGTGLGRRAE